MNVPQTVTPPTGSDMGLRVLYMLVFAVVFWLLCWTLAVVTLVQLILRLVNGRPHAEVARFGAALARYSQQIIEFLTFVTESLPYPFTPWPGENPQT
jgi:hypothetical protein